MSEGWQIVHTPGKPGYFSLVRGYGNNTEWFTDGPYGSPGTPAAWAFFELAEEARDNLEKVP